MGSVVNPPAITDSPFVPGLPKETPGNPLQILVLYFPPIGTVELALYPFPDLSDQFAMFAPLAGGADPLLGSVASNHVIKPGILFMNVFIFCCAAARSLADESDATTFTVIVTFGQSFSL